MKANNTKTTHKEKRKFVALFPLFLFAQFAFCQNNSIQNDSLKQIELKEVSVLGKVSNNILSGSTGMDIDLKKITRLPKLIGENDVYKALQHLGGVTLSGEANSGLYVRGGSSDQNLVLLDGALVHNPTHVLGMFSIFNTDVTNQLRFFKYGIPAEYGGKLSSVVDVSTLADIPEKTIIKGSLGVVMSRIMIQIPLNEKFSLYSSLRGSYISQIVFPVLRLVGVDSMLTKNRYEFWDANGGFTYKISSKTTINGSFYKGKDWLKVTELSKYNFEGNHSEWSNTVASLQINHLFSEYLSMSQKLCFSQFDILSSFDWFNSEQSIRSQLKNLTYKADFFHQYKKNTFKYGLEAQLNNTQPNFLKTDSLSPFNTNQGNNVYHSSLLALYFRNEFTWKKWLINAGIRANLYTHFGPFTDFLSEDTITYPQNKPIKTYFSVEPRFFARYLIDDSRSLKFSATRIHQFLNQIPVLSFGLPADIQLPASINVKPESSWHFSTGYFKNFNNNAWEGSMEVYYKTMENQLNFKNNIMSSFSAESVETNLLHGKGWAYGAEWRVQKNTGRFTGWITYNLSWSYRQFKDINKGNPYFDSNDRRHDISLVGMYVLNDRWSLSGLFTFASGSHINLPLSWYIIDGKTIFEYGDYNSVTLPVYHRLDMSATYKMKPIHGIKSELNFSIYNIYNRANPFQIYYSGSSQSLKMAYLLPILPSVSWNFRINQ